MVRIIAEIAKIIVQEGILLYYNITFIYKSQYVSDGRGALGFVALCRRVLRRHQGPLGGNDQKRRTETIYCAEEYKKTIYIVINVI